MGGGVCGNYFPLKVLFCKSKSDVQNKAHWFEKGHQGILWAPYENKLENIFNVFSV